MKNKLFSVDEAKKLSISEVVDLYKNFINPNQTKIYSSLPYGKDIFDKAEGVFMYTREGKKILDFTGGLGVLGLGHNHPKILEVRKKFQEEKRVEVHKIIFSKYMAALSASLAYILPNKLNKCFFLNSGAEAVEAAIKVTFKSFKGKKKYILYSNRSYHGKLIGSGSISASYKLKNQFPVMQNCVDFKFNDLEDLEKKIINCEKNGGIYAVIIEPYSASSLEACSKNFIKKLYELRKKYSFRVIFDEVFSGFFKSKKMFYFEHYDVEPDILCLSKAIGGGKSSISSLTIDDELYKKAYGDLSDTFLHTTTYNGFGEESITALEALNIFCDPKFKIKVEQLSNLLTTELENLKNNNKDKVEIIKGTGILNGIVFKSIPSSIGEIVEKIPIKFIKDKSFFLKKLTATAISCELYKKHNILASICDSSNSNHLNISPSLIIEEKEVKYFFSSLDQVLKEGINYKTIEVILNFLKPSNV